MLVLIEDADLGEKVEITQYVARLIFHIVVLPRCHVSSDYYLNIKEREEGNGSRMT
jgi:hypothetical protein